MQEHIRRAHPEKYIPKLPATEESFRLMITSKISERPHSVIKCDLSPESRDSELKNQFREFSSSPNTPVHNLKASEESHTKSISSTDSATPAALSHLQNHSFDSESKLERGWSSDIEVHRQAMRHSLEFSTPKIGNYDIRSDTFSPLGRRGELLPSILSTPQFERSSTLPPIQRIPSVNRPRKESLSKRAREPQHKRNRSKCENVNLWKVNFDRKAQSTESLSSISVGWGKRWEDLIDAATSATKDTDEDNRQKSVPIAESVFNNKEPTNKQVMPLTSLNRDSLPVLATTQSYYEGYQVSPLQQTLTPPKNSRDISDTVKLMVNGETYKDHKFEANGHPGSSLGFTSRSLQIYCAACHGLSLLGQSYACTECICGICETCVDALMANYGARRKCPKCATIGGRYKKINLEIRN